MTTTRDGNEHGSPANTRGTRLGGTIAATVTPLRDGGELLDEDAFGPLVDFLVAGRLTGILAVGTTGEGIMLEPEERRRAVERFVEASSGRLAVVVHCGAQTTAQTAALAAHAAEHEADGVAVIAPPYYPFHQWGNLLEHFRAAAAACAPLPFYVYEFADRSGYAVPTHVLHQLRETAPNLAGLKVSDTPFERFEPYLLDGLDVFVGPESLIVRGLAGGAVGVVSALGTAFPELVAAVVSTQDPGLGAQVASLRAAVQRLPMPSALKCVLPMRGVPVRPDVRAPLRTLTESELASLREAIARQGLLPSVR